MSDDASFTARYPAGGSEGVAMRGMHIAVVTFPVLLACNRETPVIEAEAQQNALDEAPAQTLAPLETETLLGGQPLYAPNFTDKSSAERRAVGRARAPEASCGDGLINDRGACFESTSSLHTPSPTTFIRALAIGDLITGGPLELVFVDSAGTLGYLPPSDDGGRLPARKMATVRTTPSSAQTIALGLLDNDSALDVAVGLSGELAVVFGDGEGGALRPLPPVVVLGKGPVQVSTGNVFGTNPSEEVLFGASREQGLRRTSGLNDADWTAQRLIVDVDPNAGNRVALAALDGNAQQYFIVGGPSGLKAFPLEVGEAGTVSVADPTTADSDGPFSGLVVGEFNGDQNDDVASIGRKSSVALHFGNGDGGFESPATTLEIPGEITPVALATGDVNGDARDDLVVVEGRGGHVDVFVNRGEGEFRLDRVDALEPMRAVAVGDLDDDGVDDIAVAKKSSIEILLSNP